MSPQLGRASRRAMAITAYCRGRYGTLPARLMETAPANLRAAIAEVDGILAIIDSVWVDRDAPTMLPSDADIDAIMSASGAPMVLYVCAVCGKKTRVEQGASFTCECGATYGEGSGA